MPRSGPASALASLLAVVALAAMPACGTAKTPTFTLSDLQGQSVTVDPQLDHRAKLLIFWASW